MGNQIMKNYPIIKSNEAVTVLFTAPRHGYVLDYSDDPYKDIQYKSDWNEGVFSKVERDWFKGKCIIVLSDKERAFVRMLIENHGALLVKQQVDDHLTKFFGNNGMWFFSDEIYDSYKQLRIPFNEIFNTQSSPSVIGFDLAKGSDTTVTTELKGVPVSASVEDRYRASVKLINDLLAENERNNGDYILNEEQVWLINELINTSQLLIDQKTPVTAKYDYKYIVNHVLNLLNGVKGFDVNIGNLYDTLSSLLTETVIAKPKMNIMVSDTNVYESSNLKLNLLIDDNLSFYIEPNTGTLSVKPKEFKPANKTPAIEWKETHEVKIGDTWFQVNPVFVSEVEMFFYDPRPIPPVMAPTNSVRQSNLSVINLNSPDYRNNEIGYLCIDDDGVLHPYDPESGVPVVKLCKNIL